MMIAVTLLGLGR